MSEAVNSPGTQSKSWGCRIIDKRNSKNEEHDRDFHKKRTKNETKKAKKANKGDTRQNYTNQKRQFLGCDFCMYQLPTIGLGKKCCFGPNLNGCRVVLSESNLELLVFIGLIVFLYFTVKYLRQYFNFLSYIVPAKLLGKLSCLFCWFWTATCTLGINTTQSMLVTSLLIYLTPQGMWKYQSENKHLIKWIFHIKKDIKSFKIFAASKQ